jgi:hypothetical protein
MTRFAAGTALRESFLVDPHLKSEMWGTQSSLQGEMRRTLEGEIRKVAWGVRR